MSPSKRDGAKQREPARTLGDLLYADAAKDRVSESSWEGLIRAIAGGDQQALSVLYELAHRLVFTLAVRITNDRATAEEVTVDVFHDVWRRAATYDGAGGSVIGWIMNQTRSRAIDRLRFDRRKKRTKPDVDAPAVAVAAPDPHDLVSVGERRRTLRDALDVLTAGERQAIQIAFFGELTYREVAARLGQPLGTVKTRVRSGLAKLREAMKDT